MKSCAGGTRLNEKLVGGHGFDHFLFDLVVLVVGGVVLVDFDFAGVDFVLFALLDADFVTLDFAVAGVLLINLGLPRVDFVGIVEGGVAFLVLSNAGANFVIFPVAGVALPSAFLALVLDLESRSPVRRARDPRRKRSGLILSSRPGSILSKRLKSMSSGFQPTSEKS